MVKYSCEKCGETFTQKGHYENHLNRIFPCDNIADEAEQPVDKDVVEKNMTKTGKNRDILDKFYTRREVSSKCIELFIQTQLIEAKDLFIEPSAGDGSFSDKCRHIL